MDEELTVDPAHLRSLGNAHHGMATHFRQVAEPDHEFVDDLPSFGSAVSGWAERAREYVANHRVTGWHDVAGIHQSIGDVHHANANDFDGHDVSGGSSVDRTATDV